MDTITEILARPDEAARQIEQLSAAVRALTAQLAEVTAERDKWKQLAEEARPMVSAAMTDLGAAADSLSAMIRRADTAEAERDAARAEVARLTAILERALPHIHPDAIYNDARAALRGDPAPAQPDAPCICIGKHGNNPLCKAPVCACGCRKSDHDPVVGCLDCECEKYTAPAGGTSELIHEIEANHKCKCGHWNGDHSESDDGGRRVCMHLGCDCIIDMAPATGRE